MTSFTIEFEKHPDHFAVIRQAKDSDTERRKLGEVHRWMPGLWRYHPAPQETPILDAEDLAKIASFLRNLDPFTVA